MKFCSIILQSCRCGGLRMRKDTLTVSFHSFLPFETFDRADFSTVWFHVSSSSRSKCGNRTVKIVPPPGRACTAMVP